MALVDGGWQPDSMTINYAATIEKKPCLFSIEIVPHSLNGFYAHPPPRFKVNNSKLEV